jgi:hypothetical protein
VKRQGRGAISVERKEAMKKKGAWSVMLAVALLLSGSLASFDTLLAKEAVSTSSESQTIKAKVGKKNIYLDSGKVQGGLGKPGGMDVYDIRFSKHGTFERLVLEIHERLINKPYDTPCFYEVTYEQYPFRLVVDLDSTRSEFSADFPNFSNSDYICGKYFLLSYDWGNYIFALTLKKPIKYEVFELHNPARIVIDIKEGDKSEKDYPPIYSLRSQSYYKSDLRDEEEKISQLAEKKVRVIKSQDKKYFMEEGYYKTEKEALERKKFFDEKGIALFIEKRKANEIPKGIYK